MEQNKPKPPLALNFTHLVALVIQRFKALLVEIDTGDPDNAALLIAIRTLFPTLPVYCLITGRPVNLNADENTKKFEWKVQHSIAAQQDGAYRYKNLLEDCGLNPVVFFDGGIACNAQLPPMVALPDHYVFQDMKDHLRSRFYPEAHDISELIKILLSYGEGEVAVLIGGPLTGLAQLIRQAGNAEAFNIIKRFGVVHAQLGTFGTAKMAEFDPLVPRGLKTFNGALDPVSTFYFMESVICPFFMVSTDAAKDDRIAYDNSAALREFLGDGRAARKLCDQYDIWQTHVLDKLKSKVYVYDFGVLISLLESMLPERLVFNMQPVSIKKIYHLARTAEEVEKWGTVEMVFSAEETGFWAAKDLLEGGYGLYHEALRQVFQQKEIPPRSIS